LKFETRSSEQATHASLFNRGPEVGQLALWLSLFPSVGWAVAIDFGIGGEKPPATAGRALRKALAGLPPRRDTFRPALRILTFPALSAMVVISRAAW